MIIGYKSIGSNVNISLHNLKILVLVTFFFSFWIRNGSDITIYKSNFVLKCFKLKEERNFGENLNEEFQRVKKRREANI